MGRETLHATSVQQAVGKKINRRFKMSHVREVKALLENLVEKVEQLTKKVDALADGKAAKSAKASSSASTKGGNK